MEAEMPPVVRRFLDQLGAILDESRNRPPHVCEDGCRCLQAYRRAIATNLGPYVGEPDR